MSIDKCPLCEQHVSHEHKKDIGVREDTNIIENEKKLKDYNFEMTSTENKIKLLKKELDVLIDGEGETEPDHYSCRSYMDAPEVDCQIYLKKQPDFKPGDLVRVKITNGLEYDLEGKFLLSL